ncbi:MAG: NUMOD4 domain-containing protein [Planctomycetota bacterium]|jgi:hypothetical protein
MEIWKDIPDHSEYQISSRGRVRSCKRREVGDWLVLSPAPHPKGYLTVSLYGIQKRTYAIHRLVLSAFIGRCPENHEACHRNGAKQDNRLENLYWGTRLDNEKDMKRLGEKTTVRGEQQGQSKLTAIQIQKIRQLAKSGIAQSKIADRFGVTQQHISKIVTRKQWRHI